MPRWKFSTEHLLWLAAATLVVFFGRWGVKGLQPDAALYAGLSAKVLDTGEGWLLTGSEGFFPKYFEHPPFFFQWGALVLKFLGRSDGAARAIGGIPGALAFFVMLFWIYRRMGWVTAAVGALMLASFGHYTKFATTSLMEGPLSLAFVLAAIATWELHWKPRTGLKRPFWTVMLFAGLALATASKGVVGLGAWGGLALSLLFAFIFSERASFKILFSALFLGLALAACLAPFGLWAWQLFERGGLEWIEGYVFKQVLRSATSNRGEVFHAEMGDKLYYLKLMFKEGWPWWWTVPAAYVSVLGAVFFKKRWPSLQRFKDPVLTTWAFNALAFTLAVVVPFSLTRYQLPHYIHPTYLLLTPLAAGWLVRLAGAEPIARRLESPRLRWGLVVIVAVLLRMGSPEVSLTPNRGQDFIEAASKLDRMQGDCEVLVSEKAMDPYRMEAYSLWYWAGRKWSLTKNPLPSRIAVPGGKVYWDPGRSLLWGEGKCRS